MKANKRSIVQRPFLLTIFLVILGLVLVPLRQGFASTSGNLTLETSFDNPQVEEKTKSERVLELLMTAPAQVLSSNSRVSMNIALVIDTSGSMAQEGKLDMVKMAAHDILDQLRPGDRFALVTYNDAAQADIPSEAVESLMHAHRLINALHSGGSTHLAAGLREGYRQLHRHLDTTKINRLFLLSDGLANRGETHPRRLGDLVEQEERNGISLSTFGVGLEFNETLMAELSERGRGMYYFIDEPARIEEILAQAFRSTQEIIAKNVVLQVQLHPAASIHEVYANSYQILPNEITIQAGDLSVGELRRIHIRLTTPALGQGLQQISQVRMHFQQPGQATPITQILPMSLRYGTFGKEIEKTRNWAVSERTKVFEAHYARDRAAQVFDSGDVVTAKRILQESLENLRNAKVHGKKITKELDDTSTYLQSLEQQLDRSERAKCQKSVKYKKYMLEGC